ncbi:rab 6 [Brachionus plicatilis]|uniref:Rab 6 n=1 Tax=Brachionus plicatilis TaxID=10195 RepID=A0A3M7SW53_BRAPC|nr:rab 6 [Brachionus plicatilis]
MRLQGQPFKELYETSDEIKVANIQWNYKTTDDVVKVEVWDVVDRSKKKRNLLQQKISSSNTLKFDHSSSAEPPVEASLDAEFIDVYKNANGCILVYDITKQWTWDYIERELPKIPSHLPVLVIGNHRDMNHHRTVDESKCKYFLENLNRGSLGSAVRYTETSMRTGYGMTYLYKFFNIPFLQLQRENLMQQLEINAKETDLICEELQMIEENIEVDYNNFIDTLNSKRRQQQEDNAKDVLKNAMSIEQARKVAQEKETAMAAARQQADLQLSEPKKVINNIINKINTKVHENLPQPQQVSMSVTIDPSKKNTPSNLNKSQSMSPINLNIEELAHDDDLNRFLEDPVKTEEKLDNKKQTKYDEDEEEESNNPMVAAFKEEIDSSDEESGKNKVSTQVNVSDNEPEETIIDQKNENVFSKMSSHNSSSSNTSSNLGSSLIQVKNSSNFETISSATSISLVNCDSTSQTSYSMPVLENQMADIKFSNDDFEFLEKVSTEQKPKVKSKKSSKTEDGSEEFKLKSKKKKSKNKDLDGFLDPLDEKKEKKKSKKKDSKLVKTKIYQDEDEEDNSVNVNIKRDLDYEEL